MQWGAVPGGEPDAIMPAGYHRIDSPSSRKAYSLAFFAGLVLLIVLCVGLGTWSWIGQGDTGIATAGDAESPWAAVAIALALFIPLHELLHLLGHPEYGTSDRSVLAIWLKKLRFGVYYEGCMTRRRWLLMRLAPMVALSVLPACLVALLQVRPWTADIEVGLQVLMIVNALGSGGDVVAAILVMTQVPAKADICFETGRAYWRPA